MKVRDVFTFTTVFLFANYTSDQLIIFVFSLNILEQHTFIYLLFIVSH